jgi:hypothetical protein
MAKVKVTQRDITSGVVEDPEACPVARGIRRLVKRGVTVFVMGDDGVEFIHKDKTVRRKLPAKAKDFIFDFDDVDGMGAAVQPIEFEMNIPEALLK